MTIVGLMVSACSLTPDYSRPKMDLPQQWNQSAPNAATGQSWNAFGSEEMNKLIAQALAQNNDLDAGLHRVEAARANARIAGATLWPSIEANASIGRERDEPDGGPDSTTDNWRAGGSVAYELDLWGKNRAGASAATRRAKATQFDYNALALVTASDTATSYASLLATKERVAVAERNLANARDILNIVQARFDAGSASGLELSQQKAAVATAEAALAELRNTQVAFSNQLAVLTGVAPQGFSVKANALSTVKAPAIGVIKPIALLDTRPDIQRAEAEMQAANFDIGVARAAFFPSLNLGLDAALIAVPAADPASLIASAAASVTQPLFKGGALTGGLTLAKARQAELVASYRQAVLNALRETENALSGVNTASTRADALETARIESENAYTFARDRYDAGAIDYQTLLDTQRALLSAEDNAVTARLARITAGINLYKAMGGV